MIKYALLHFPFSDPLINLFWLCCLCPLDVPVHYLCCSWCGWCPVQWHFSCAWSDSWTSLQGWKWCMEQTISKQVRKLMVHPISKGLRGSRGSFQNWKLGMHRYHFFQYSPDTDTFIFGACDTGYRYRYFHCICTFFKYWVQKPKEYV